MKLRLLVMLGLLAVFWVAAREMRKRLFGEPGATWEPEQETAPAASIPQMVRTEPLQPSAAPATGEAPEPAEDEAVTPPHGDPLGREVAEGAEDGAGEAPAETVAENQPEGTAGGAGDGAAPPA